MEEHQATAPLAQEVRSQSQSSARPLPSSQRKTWLITGCSSGLGLSIALCTLRAGHRVLACARNPDRARSEYPELERLGGRWVKLDVTDLNAQSVVEGYVREEERDGEGGIDVVVNNAGYALQGSIDDMSDEEISLQLQTTFYGAIRVLRGVLPSMRSRRRGWILNMSSILGFAPAPEAMMYSAAKAALESITESYASLLAPFNIQVAILEPGMFRSRLTQSSVWPAAGTNPDYEARMKPWRDLIDAMVKNPEMNRGDPEKLAKRVVEWVDSTGMFTPKDAGVVNGQEPGHEENGREARVLKPDGKVTRLILGPDSYGAWGARLEQLKENYESMKEVANSTSIVDAGGS